MRPASLAVTALTTTLTLAAGAFSGPASTHGVGERIARIATITRASGFDHAAARAADVPSGFDHAAARAADVPSGFDHADVPSRFGRSIGSPTAGRLIGGAHLVESDYLRIEPNDTAGDVRWGLEPLVSMLDRAGRSVRRQFPGAVLSVGHLSRAGGGDIDRHRSHESGRDADVGFFVRSSSGRQLLSPHFVAFRGDGTAPSWPGAYFDDVKNWALVAAMVGDAEAHVTHVFVASPLRARMLAYAERIGAPQETRMRAAELMQQPRGVLPHDDHFHVRIGCPAHMTGCVENPTTRASRTSPPAARGHRGTPPRALVTPAPRRTSPTPAAPAARPDETVPEPAEPPALLSVPIDDVDG